MILAGNRKPFGFTLLELLVVLVIIGLMAGLVAPRMTGTLAGTQLKTAAKKVAGALRYARSRAASEKAVYRSVVDVDGGWLALIGPDASPQPGLTANAWSDEGVPVYRLPSGVRFAGTESSWRGPDGERFEIRFFPTGASTGGSVVLVGEDQRELAVRVDLITGRVVLDG